MPTARNISKGVTTTDTTQKQTQKRLTRHRIVPPPKITTTSKTNKIVAKRINKHYRDKEERRKEATI